MPAARCILYSCDTFKGTLTSQKVGEAVEKGLSAAFAAKAPREWGALEHVHCPMSDGGAGLLDSVTFRSGDSPGALRRGASFGCNVRENTVVIEMAAAAGLPLIARPTDRDPLRTTSYGVGQVTAYALQHVASERRALGLAEGGARLFMGIGGSATNEGGLGALQALGLCIYVKDDAGGERLLERPFTGADLGSVTRAELSDAFRARFVGPSAAVGETRLICDVDNPLTGPRGATYVFGPQKCSPALGKAHDGRGAAEDTAVGEITNAQMRAVLQRLEDGMRHAAERIVRSTHGSGGLARGTSEAAALEQLLHGAGGGGAGGMSGFFHYVVGADWAPGAEAVAAILGLRAADGSGRLRGLLHDRPPALVVTGEGSFDEQTIAYHKTVGRLLEMVVEANLLRAGRCGGGAEAQARSPATRDVLIVCGRCGFSSEGEAVLKTRAELLKVMLETTKDSLAELFAGKSTAERKALVERALPNLRVMPLTPKYANFKRATTQPAQVLVEAIPQFLAGSHFLPLSPAISSSF